MNVVKLTEWPGKKNEEGEELPAYVHMLDVAACGQILIEGHTAFSNLTENQRKAMILLVALHDVGKLSESFRALIRENRTGAPRHWQLSNFLLRHCLDDQLKGLGSSPNVRCELYGAVSGHHGQPPDGVEGNRFEKHKQKKCVGVDGERIAKDWSGYLLSLFPEATLDDIGIVQAQALSWALSGLTVASDWVGSNTNWFPLNRKYKSLDAAWQDSQIIAAKAIEEAGLYPAGISTSKSDSLMGLTNLRPMQKAALNVQFEKGPQLIVLEDSTGSGKTEAALILAKRMIAEKKVRGLFFALPTMATSDAIFERICPVVSELFEKKPTVILTHGRAKQYQSIRQLRGGSNDNTPEADHTEWLTDNRRRAMLASVCVGTIDQALLGILPTKFSTLRLFGLSDKLLIVDEAHSYDPYMQEELKGLLRMQASLGGSAVVMTATLPLSSRAALINAFQTGLGKCPEAIKQSYYPGVHLVGQSVRSESVKPVTGIVRRIKVSQIPSVEEALEILSVMAEKGAACIWIRNAVDEAIKIAENLSQRGIKNELLHARFAMIDRLGKERRVIQRFGKDGSDREGRVLVATQVVEASLDLDFDVMVTDLAPIGSLIQRAGRLWRHMDVRPSDKRPVSGPTLHIVSPNPDNVDNADWLEAALGSGRWVYQLDEQWKTARTVFDEGVIDSPNGLRKVIEAVHGESEISMPDVILKERNKLEGQFFAQAGIARANVVDCRKGFTQGASSISNDAEFPTRLAEKQITLVLARRNKNKEIRPWADHQDEAMAWALSELTASKRKFESLLPDQNCPDIRTIKEKWPAWKQEAHKLCLVTNGMIGDNLRYDDEVGLRSNSSSN